MPSLADTLNSSLKSLLDADRVAAAKARFRAWWEGEPFDPATVAAKTPANDAGRAEIPEADKVRLEALEVVWGEKRLGPSVRSEAEVLAALGAGGKEGVLAVFGPGRGAPLAGLAEAGRSGPVSVYEWREEARATLQRDIAALPGKIAFAPQDLDLFAAPAEAWDGVVSFDEFTYAPTPARLAAQIAKGLKPGGAAVVETYVKTAALAPDMVAQAFASSFAEPNLITQDQLRQALEAAGLEIVEDQDQSLALVTAMKARFEALEGALAGLDEEKMPPPLRREIAWECESCLARLRLLLRGELRQVALTVRKPA